MFKLIAKVLAIGFAVSVLAVLVYRAQTRANPPEAPADNRVVDVEKPVDRAQEIEGPDVFIGGSKVEIDANLVELSETEIQQLGIEFTPSDTTYLPSSKAAPIHAADLLKPSEDLIIIHSEESDTIKLQKADRVFMYSSKSGLPIGNETISELTEQQNQPQTRNGEAAKLENE